MVSSSATQVAPLPSMHAQGKDLVSVDVPSGQKSTIRHLPNGYQSPGSGKLPPSEHTSLLANGSANSADTLSEPSTRDSGDLSPRSEGSEQARHEKYDGFVDAPQASHELHEARRDPGSTPQELGDHENAENVPLLNKENDESAIVEEGPSTVKTSSQQPPKLDPKKNVNRNPSGSRSSASKRAAAVAAAELADDVLIGTRVSEGHENFVTAYNMLTGIRVAVSRCTAKINRSLTDSDFTATDEINFDLSGEGYNPSSKYIFEFKDYAPWVFRHLRDVFRLDPADYLMSLTAKYIVSELGSPGKSGSFFYYSRDYRFIIKTIRHSEHKLLRRILKQYYHHVKSNQDTLISQFYGLHRVKLPFGRKIHFVVMNNVFPALYEIHERYDLKGSLLGREYHPDLTKPIVVYKDLDWLRRHRRIVLGPEKRERLVKQLEMDTRFLQRVNVMDYSLLIGIHDMSKGNAALNTLLRLEEFGPQDSILSEIEKRDAKAAVDKQSNKLGKQPSARDKSRTAQKDFAELQTLLKKATPEKLKEFDFADEYRSEFYFYHDHGGFQSTDDHNEELDVIYYVGIIDFLTGYTFRKSVETFCKSLIHDRRELSAVPANEYGDRFLKFLRGCIGPAIPSTRPQKRESKVTGGTQQATTPKITTSSPGQVRQPKTPEAETQPRLGATAPRTPSPRTGTGSPSGMRRSPSQPGTAITSPQSSGTTAVKPSSPIPESSSRRPSVAGYGQDSFKES